MNEHDVEKMAGLLRAAGFEAAPRPEAAGVVIVNTCCIRQKAEQKFYSMMGRLKELKERQPLLLGVTGCIAQMEKEAIVERLPFVDFSLGPASVHLVCEAVNAGLKRERFLDFSENGCLSSLYVRPGNAQAKVKAYVTIMKGCDNFCAYCVVPYVRGREASRKSADILEEIEELDGCGDEGSGAPRPERQLVQQRDERPVFQRAFGADRRHGGGREDTLRHLPPQGPLRRADRLLRPAPESSARTSTCPSSRDRTRCCAP